MSARELPHVNYDGILVETPERPPSVFDPSPGADPRPWYMRHVHQDDFHPPLPAERPFIPTSYEALPYTPFPPAPKPYSGDSTEELVAPEPVANPVLAAARRMFRPGDVRQVPGPSTD